jgi:hypothetical protein
MCPICITQYVTSAVLIAFSVTSTGGLAAIALRKFGVKHAVDNNPVPTGSKEDHHG